MPVLTTRDQVAHILHVWAYRFGHTWSMYVYLAALAIWAIALSLGSLNSPELKEGVLWRAPDGLFETGYAAAAGLVLASAMLVAAIFTVQAVCGDCENGTVRYVALGPRGRTAFAFASAILAAVAVLTSLLIACVVPWALFALHGVAFVQAHAGVLIVWLLQAFLLCIACALVTLLIGLATNQITWAALFALLWTAIDGFVHSLVPAGRFDSLSVSSMLDQLIAGETLGATGCLTLTAIAALALAALVVVMRKKGLA